MESGIDNERYVERLKQHELQNKELRLEIEAKNARIAELEKELQSLRESQVQSGDLISFEEEPTVVSTWSGSGGIDYINTAEVLVPTPATEMLRSRAGSSSSQSEPNSQKLVDLNSAQKESITSPETRSSSSPEKPEPAEKELDASHSITALSSSLLGLETDMSKYSITSEEEARLLATPVPSGSFQSPDMKRIVNDSFSGDMQFQLQVQLSLNTNV